VLNYEGLWALADIERPKPSGEIGWRIVMLKLRSVARFLVVTGMLWACGGTANSAGTGSGSGSFNQQPPANPAQPSPSPQQPTVSSNQPPATGQQPPSNSGLDCSDVCARIGAAGCDQLAGQCMARCAVTHNICATEIAGILSCVAASACVDSDFSDTCAPVYDIYLRCEGTLVSGGSGGNGAGGNGAGGDGAAGRGPPPGGAGGGPGGTCTQQGDQCLGCTTTCDICTCSTGLTPAACGC
jgi:hypothetical protein